jgi:saccharopine dehydrogenase-like NADP-dependent oxidoreductase
MKSHYNIVIAGAGGIAKAAALIMAEWSEVTPTIYIGDRTKEHAQEIVNWIMDGTTKKCDLIPYKLNVEDITDEMKAIFQKGDALLDCLPGSLAPKMAQFAKDFDMHYANLTEYVDETNQIIELAKNAKTGFVLQTGLAPGYINVLANNLFKTFCKEYKVDKAESLVLKVGAMTDHAVAPHFYGYTWSPVGVATEYMKDATVIRDYEKMNLPSLSERASIIIDGIAYEEDLTSGGAADLPDALRDKVRNLDYKTLRHPGHYEWIREQLISLNNSDNIIAELHQIMIAIIPHIEDDQIVIYAAVQGYDLNQILRRQEIAKKILPKKVGNHLLRAIQITTATPLIQSIQWLLETKPKGVILQSQIDEKQFLNGNFILPVYGEIH